jgi:hypothetical protein
LTKKNLKKNALFAKKTCSPWFSVRVLKKVTFSAQSIIKVKKKVKKVVQKKFTYFQPL